MKLVKSLLLGSAAGLAAVVGAQAADLPVKKAAPVEYVRICSTYGAGFFYIPGTEGCLRVAGLVRAEYDYREPFFRGEDAIGFRARGRVQLDHRLATPYGLLRTFVRLEINRDSGVRNGPFGNPVHNPAVAQAFIQFGGLTAGRVTSFFDNADLATAHMIGLRFSDAPDTQVLAYTYSFGNGFSASIAIEDPEERDTIFAIPGLLPGFLNGGQYAVVEGGNRIPDIVGNIKYNGSWGTMQLSAATHQVRDAGLVNGRTIGIAPNTVQVPFADSEFGFAVQLNGSFNLDSIAPGDRLWFNAAYAKGALAYLNGTGAGFGGFGTVEAIPTFATDAVVNPLTGDLSLSHGWSFAAGGTHYWGPTVRTSLFGSYARIDAPGFASAVNGNGAVIGLFDASEWKIGTNTFWSPVSGLDIGVEVLYTRLDPRGRVTANVVGPGGTFVTTAGDADVWQGRLRIQRAF